MANPADGHDVIRVHGARVNNLRDVSVEVPKRRLTVFTGVSGSGKSSLVFGTIAAESQRLLNETHTAFVQGFLATPPRPEVDLLDGLTAAIVVDQSRLGTDPRSTVGTATDAYALLRTVWSRLGEPHVGPPSAFSFNTASVRASGSVTVDRGAGRGLRTHTTFSRLGGMCPRCEGRGAVTDWDVTQLVDADRSLREGALLVPGYSVDGWQGRIFLGAGTFDPDKPVRDYTARERHELLHGEPRKIKVDGINLTYEGLVPKISKSMLSKDVEALQPHVRAFVERAVTFTVCPDCNGTRLNEAARSCLVAGRGIAEVCAWQVTDLADWVRGLHEPAVAPLLAAVSQVLDAFVRLGLGYLSLDRPAGSLSGGEAQRVKLVRQLGSALTDVTYVFDEPTSGLHPHDVHRTTELLQQLRDKGNTVLVVEHDPEVVLLADHVVDLGPGAGTQGGQVVYEGDVAGLRTSGTLTGRHLADRTPLKTAVRTPTGVLPVRGARTHNLQDVDVDVPLGVLVVLTGVAGSGKSSLVTGSVAGRDGVVAVDQAPVKGSRRSSPATYTGLLEPVRKAFAKANGVKPALFSSNSEGACPTCGGAGTTTPDLGLVAGVAVPCEDCDGKGFAPSVLQHRLAGRDISEVLQTPVSEATGWFAEAGVPAAATVVQRLADVGLGYLRLGQPLPSLSGGERQRLKLAARMGEPATLYVLDEPTAGLHPADVEALLGLLDRLVDGGTSVLVVEHSLAVVAHADHVVDLGPGAGSDGGRVVFEGTPRALAGSGTLTGQHLAAYLDG